jgi:hypothetical protein
LVGNTTINNDLKVAEGTLQGYNNTYTLTVTGNAHVESGGVLNRSDIDAETFATGNMSFNSLTVDSGGAFYAPSGTLTITGQGDADSGTDGFGLMCYQGTFKHNSGLFFYNGAGGADFRFAADQLGNSKFVVANSSGSTILLLGDAGGGNVQFNGDLTIDTAGGQGGLYKLNGASYALNVKGNMYMRSTGDDPTWNFNFVQTGDINVDGILHIEGGTFNTTQGKMKVGGLRLLGGKLVDV